MGSSGRDNANILGERRHVGSDEVGRSFACGVVDKLDLSGMNADHQVDLGVGLCPPNSLQHPVTHRRESYVPAQHRAVPEDVAEHDDQRPSLPQVELTPDPNHVLDPFAPEVVEAAAALPPLSQVCLDRVHLVVRQRHVPGCDPLFDRNGQITGRLPRGHHYAVVEEPLLICGEGDAARGCQR